MAKYYYEQWDFTPDLSAFTSKEVSAFLTFPVQLLNKNGNLSGIFTTVRNMSLGEACIPGNETTPSNFAAWDEGLEVEVRVKKSSTSFDQYQITKPNFIASLRPTILITTIQAEEGTYPDNGIQGDYWYIKTRKAFPDLHIKVNGELRKVQSAWVKVGGHTTPELPEGHREYIAYSNSPDGVQDFSLTPDGHAYVGLYQGLDVDSLRGNRVRNSNFEDGDYWAAYFTNIRVVDNSAHITYNNSGDSVGYPNMRQQTVGITKAGDKYYVSFEVFENNNTTSSVHFQTGGIFTPTIPRGFNGKLSAVYTPTRDDDFIYFNSAVSPNQILDYKIKNVYLVNLTEEYGAGNEPTKEYMDSLPWTPAPADILADINNPSSYRWMSKSMYDGVLKEVKDIYIKKDGQLKKGI